jgi:hypothetical protein
LERLLSRISCLEDVRPAINNSVLVIYRIFAVVSLYTVLAGVLVFALIAAFYASSHTWVAPVILSEVDKDTLDLTGKLLTTQSTVDDLKLDVVKLGQTVTEAQTHMAALERLRPAIDTAISRENQHKQETGPMLVTLDEQKRGDVVHTRRILDSLDEVDAGIDKELAAGLINKTDAMQAKMVFVKSQGYLTDSRIANTLLKDTIMEKMVPSTTYLEALDKKAELESEIATLGITIEAAKQQISTESSQIEQFNAALATAKQTPFWVAMQGGRVDLALVPYDNQTVAVAGAPVYDCYLSFVICRQVGTLKAAFAGEQHATHPIFRTDLRGFLVQLNLNSPESAKSKTLFVGSKPLLF